MDIEGSYDKVSRDQNMKQNEQNTTMKRTLEGKLGGK